MTAASGKPIDRILPTFVNYPGVPVIDVALRCDGAHSQLTLTSERFFTDPAMATAIRGPSSWQIPLCIKTPRQGAAACQAA